MRFLVDTHLLIWAAFDDRRLSDEGRQLLGDHSNKLFFSSASMWELAIKSALPAKPLNFDPAKLRKGLLYAGYEELAVTGDHALEVANLPRIHRDPFDGILVAQAKSEGLVLLTSDSTLVRYGKPVRLV